MKKGKQNSQTVPVTDSDSDLVTSALLAAGSENLDDGDSDLDLGEFVIEIDSDYELADEEYLRHNLLDPDADPDDWSGRVTRVLAPNLIVGDSDTDVVLAARLGDGERACIESVRWTQIGGTSVDLGRVAGNERLVRVPDVLVEQELIFEVEVLRRGERLVQEVAVRVQPTSNQGTPPGERHQCAGELRDAEVSPAVGKLWGAVRAFFGGKSAPRGEQ